MYSEMQHSKYKFILISLIWTLGTLYSGYLFFTLNFLDCILLFSFFLPTPFLCFTAYLYKLLHTGL